MTSLQSQSSSPSTTVSSTEQPTVQTAVQPTVQSTAQPSTFLDMKLPEALNHTLAAMQFSEPTPVQQQAIPVALQGRDILGSAQTGTGKTGAFGIPIIASLMSDPEGTALIMTPTRELAAQVLKQLQMMLGKRSKIPTALLIGGESMIKQYKQLDKQPRLVVGTPGRIHDHLTRGKLNLDDTKFLVLDETDRMLDMGFSIQIEAILEFMPEKRQTMLFSATLPRQIQKMAAQYLDNPLRIAIDSESLVAKNISHDVIKLTEADKYPRLLNELDERAGSIIIFMKTKFATEKMVTKLAGDGYDAKAVHGDLRQNKRERVIAAFRKQKYRVLVATDVAARGLDIPHIEHVINYDLPQCPEDYIHRIGRTARAGASGAAVCFVSSMDKGKWIRIDRLMNPDAHKGSNRNSSDRRKRFEDDGFGDNRSERRRDRFKKPGSSRKEAFGKSHKRGAFKDGFREERRGDARSDSRSGFRSESKGESRDESRREPRGSFKGNSRSSDRFSNPKRDFDRNPKSYGAKSDDSRSGGAKFGHSRSKGARSYDSRSERSFERNDKRANSEKGSWRDRRGSDEAKVGFRKEGATTRSGHKSGHGSGYKSGHGSEKSFSKRFDRNQSSEKSGQKGFQSRGFKSTGFKSRGAESGGFKKKAGKPSSRNARVGNTKARNSKY